MAKSLKIAKGESEAVNRMKTDNAMVKLLNAKMKSREKVEKYTAVIT
jgi:hypothetical protein